jgi:hypothetical protein
MGSPLSNFITWLHTRAVEDGRVPNLTPEAYAVMLGILGEPLGDNPNLREAHLVGLELHDGRPHSDLARRIQRRAVSELSDLELTLQNVDAAGYTPINLRALLSMHFDTLRYAPLGSDANVTYLDIKVAINKASDKTRTVAWLLVAGIGPQALGKLLDTNGSRRINRALAELARILEGRCYARNTVS